MEKREGGLVPPERPARGEPDDRRFVQRQHEPEVIRKTCEKRHFGRPGIAEDRCQASVPKDIEGRVADGSLAHSRGQYRAGPKFGMRTSVHMLDKERNPDYVQSLERGLAVIRVFGAETPELRLSDVARATGLTRATARRFLLTLVRLGYVRQDGSNFSLRPRVLELGYAYLSALSLPEVAHPHMESLVAEVNESSSIAVLDDLDIVYVARVPTQRIMSITIAVGTRLPAYATSMGRVLLAGLDPTPSRNGSSGSSWSRSPRPPAPDIATLRREDRPCSRGGVGCRRPGAGARGSLRRRSDPGLGRDRRGGAQRLRARDPNDHAGASERGCPAPPAHGRGDRGRPQRHGRLRQGRQVPLDTRFAVVEGAVR